MFSDACAHARSHVRVCHMWMILVEATFGQQMSQTLGGHMQMFPLLIREYWCADLDQEVDLQTFI